MDGYSEEKDQRFWTQVLFSTKNRFQNPLHQNYKHTRALADYLKIDHRKIHSIVFFIGDNVELKGDFPLNVMTSGISSYIKKFNEFLFPDIEIIRLGQCLKQLKTNNTLSPRQHVQILKEKYSCDTICPRCGGELVRRIAKPVREQVQSFWAVQSFLIVDTLRNEKTSNKFLG